MTDPRDLADEYLGLASGFLFAGASSVLSTLWAVQEAPAMLLSARYYSERQRGARPSAALRAAQRWLRGAGPADVRRTLNRADDLERLGLLNDVLRDALPPDPTIGPALGPQALCASHRLGRLHRRQRTSRRVPGDRVAEYRAQRTSRNGCARHPARDDPSGFAVEEVVITLLEQYDARIDAHVARGIWIDRPPNWQPGSAWVWSGACRGSMNAISIAANHPTPVGSSFRKMSRRKLSTFRMIPIMVGRK